MSAGNSSRDNHENQQSNPIDQLLQILQQLNKPNQNSNESSNQNVILTKKLNSKNYMKWSKLMYLVINGRGLLSYITTDPPSVTNLKYTKWIQKDSLVFSWIIENIHSDLVTNFWNIQ